MEWPPGFSVDCSKSFVFICNLYLRVGKKSLEEGERYEQQRHYQGHRGPAGSWPPGARRLAGAYGKNWSDEGSGRTHGPGAHSAADHGIPAPGESAPALRGSWD